MILCDECGRIFETHAVFDWHRATRNGVCLNGPEMRDRGAVMDPRGIWRHSGPERFSGPQHRVPAGNRSGGS